MNRSQGLICALSSILLLSWSPWAGALVPGPILLHEDSLKALQADENVKLLLPQTRSRVTCLTVSGQRFCPGSNRSRAEMLYAQLDDEEQLRVRLLVQGSQLTGLLAFLPNTLVLPAPDFNTSPITLGPEPAALETVLAQWPEQPTRQALSELVQVGKAFQSEDYYVWYDAQRRLGLITHRSEQGEYVIGAFVGQ